MNQDQAAIDAMASASASATTASKKHFVTTFYKFARLTNLEEVQQILETKALELGIRGLVILGAEGINSTVAAASQEALDLFKNWVREYLQAPDLLFKNSTAPSIPFRRFKVKIRDEIVTLGTPDLFPAEAQNRHLTPDQWNQVLKEETDFLLIDTRNWYETKIGTFKGAIDPKIEQFTEFPEWVDRQEYPKDKKMLIFCTGGIRCEKGILELQRRGYNNVFQLGGGILKYIEEKPNDQFEGECFVFDHRVAVDQTLQPSVKFKLCPHCGQPAEIKITCQRCDTETLICEDCSAVNWVKDTCTKNCAYQLERHPGRKGARQRLPFEMGQGVSSKKSSGKALALAEAKVVSPSSTATITLSAGK
jgi:UPF0176 protein